MAPSLGRCLCDRPDNRENAVGHCIQWTPALRNGLATLLLVAYQQHVGGGVAAFCDKMILSHILTRNNIVGGQSHCR